MKQLINYYSLFSVLTITVGFILGYSSSLKYERDYLEICLSDFSEFSFDFNVFQIILMRNFIVSIFLSIGGYFTAGLLTILVLLWNGFNIGTMFTLIPYTNLNFYEFLNFFVIHGVFEITALVLFSNIGLKGFLFFKNIFKNNTMKINLNIKIFIPPCFLLIFAALIETFLISNF